VTNVFAVYAFLTTCLPANVDSGSYRLFIPSDVKKEFKNMFAKTIAKTCVINK